MDKKIEEMRENAEASFTDLSDDKAVKEQVKSFLDTLLKADDFLSEKEFLLQKEIKGKTNYEKLAKQDMRTLKLAKKLYFEEGVSVLEYVLAGNNEFKKKVVLSNTESFLKLLYDLNIDIFFDCQDLIKALHEYNEKNKEEVDNNYVSYAILEFIDKAKEAEVK